jgi:hypothetical protein
MLVLVLLALLAVIGRLATTARGGELGVEDPELEFRWCAGGVGALLSLSPASGGDRAHTRLDHSGSRSQRG